MSHTDGMSSANSHKYWETRFYEDGLDQNWGQYKKDVLKEAQALKSRWHSALHNKVEDAKQTLFITQLAFHKIKGSLKYPKAKKSFTSKNASEVSELLAFVSCDFTRRDYMKRIEEVNKPQPTGESIESGENLLVRYFENFRQHYECVNSESLPVLSENAREELENSVTELDIPRGWNDIYEKLAELEGFFDFLYIAFPGPHSQQSLFDILIVLGTLIPKTNSQKLRNTANEGAIYLSGMLEPGKEPNLRANGKRTACINITNVQDVDQQLYPTPSATAVIFRKWVSSAGFKECVN